MEDCLFCSIAAGKIPSTKVYEDDTVYVFKDIAPIAPIHYLLIPKQHIACAADITPENSGVVAHIYEVAAKIAAKEGISDGFRIITNCGEMPVRLFTTCISICWLVSRWAGARNLFRQRNNHHTGATMGTGFWKAVPSPCSHP